MRVRYMTIKNQFGSQSIVRGPNEYGEYVVKFYEANQLLNEDSTAFETDLHAAIETAHCMTFGFLDGFNFRGERVAS